MKIERNQVYKCEHCGNIADILHGGGPKLFCCNKPMVLLEENTVDAAVEKHVPVVTKVDGGFKVAVGNVAHPMADDHHIEWIEVLENGSVHRQFLSPGEAPEAFFALEADSVTARAYCNLHGFWKS